MIHTSSRPTQTLKLPPLSLYIHIPWCVRKCPYCDFNSHEHDGALPIHEYVDMLKRDLASQVPYTQGRAIHSIFFGGGTPSLFPAEAISDILNHIKSTIDIAPNAEITLEANPGTTEYSRFDALRAGGVNRLSFGAQSFDNHQLESLGRIHRSDEIHKAIEKAKDAGFDNFNIDLMHGLSNQSTEDALKDLREAIALSPTHVSWYQLTIEPNTAFYSKPPILPDDDDRCDIYQAGKALLKQQRFDQYEVSAYALNDQRSMHNLNYWRFGDYLAIGAGAHGKITLIEQQHILRFSQTRSPKDYLKRTEIKPATYKTIEKEERALEFMMNTLRLKYGVPASYFSERTGLNLSEVNEKLCALRARDLLENNVERIQPTENGLEFLNDVLAEFL